MIFLERIAFFKLFYYISYCKFCKNGIFQKNYELLPLKIDFREGMSADFQIKLLRVLRKKEIMRAGGHRIIKIDIRIIAASDENIS
ncbi:sigma 54-interacting transcriptional regulator [Treponema pedis]|uniref:sigma 54-interacting transcriptional regulator n=1 Tax=Treponema pedis TaxID=409322 RepID=UPI003D2372D4